MMIKIDDGIPPPSNGSGKARFPWREMQPGQSFFAPNTTTYKFAGSLAYGRKVLGQNVKLAARTVTENGVTGVRVWRLK